MTQRSKEILSLSVILIAALAVRLIFFTGMVRGDSLNYAHAAFELSRGSFEYGAWEGNSRIGLFGPVVALYALFGPSEATTLAFPILSSLASVVFVYLIARMFAGSSAGLIAAIIWALLPLDVHLATSLLPDSPLAALSTGAVYFLFRAERRVGPGRWMDYALSFLLVLWAILVKPLAIVSLIFIVVYLAILAWKKYGERVQKVLERMPLRAFNGLKFVGPVLLLLLFFAYAMAQPRPLVVALARTASDVSEFSFTGATELDFSDVRFSQSNLLVYSAPLFLVATVVGLAKERRRLWPLLLWLGVIYSYYEWGSIELNPLVYIPLEPFNEARNLLFVLAPLSVIAGAYLGTNMEPNFARIVLPIIAMALVWISAEVRAALFSGLAPAWIAASGAIVVVGAALSPLVLKTKKSLANILVAAYLLFFSLSALQPVLPYHAVMYKDQAETLDNLRRAAEYLGKHPGEAIYTPQPIHAMNLNYASVFRLGYDWAKSGVEDQSFRIRDYLPLARQNRGYVLITGVGGEIPEQWVLVERFGTHPETSVWIYQLADTMGGQE